MPFIFIYFHLCTPETVISFEVKRRRKRLKVALTALPRRAVPRRHCTVFLRILYDVRYCVVLQLISLMERIKVLIGKAERHSKNNLLPDGKSDWSRLLQVYFSKYILPEQKVYIKVVGAIKPICGSL